MSSVITSIGRVSASWRRRTPAASTPGSTTSTISRWGRFPRTAGPGLDPHGPRLAHRLGEAEIRLTIEVVLHRQSNARRAIEGCPCAPPIEVLYALFRGGAQGHPSIARRAFDWRWS